MNLAIKKASFTTWLSYKLLLLWLNTGIDKVLLDFHKRTSLLLVRGLIWCSFLFKVSHPIQFLFSFPYLVWNLRIFRRPSLLYASCDDCLYWLPLIIRIFLALSILCLNFLKFFFKYLFFLLYFQLILCRNRIRTIVYLGWSF